jgi:HEAT repeat protein
MKTYLPCRWRPMAAALVLCALRCLTDAGCHRPSPEPPLASDAGGATASAEASRESPAAAPSQGATPGAAQPEAAQAEPKRASAEAGAAGKVAVAKGASDASSSGPQRAADPSLRALVGRYLQSDDQGAYRPEEKAATALERLSPEQTEALWTLLSDPDVQVRRGAAFFLLGQLDPQQPDQFQAFAALLDDPDRTIRGLALAALRQAPRPQQLAQLDRVVPRLDPAHEEHAEHRANVARWLGQLREDAHVAVPALSAAARTDPDPRVRGAALVAVCQVALPEAALPLLVEGLRDQDASVRLVAAARLRQMDVAAAPAADPLAERLADEDPRVSQAAAAALVRIGAPAVTALARQLAAPQPAVRKLALRVLAELGPAAAPARPQIEACRSDTDPEIRRWAEGILARLPAR